MNDEKQLMNILGGMVAFNHLVCGLLIRAEITSIEGLSEAIEAQAHRIAVGNSPNDYLLTLAEQVRGYSRLGAFDVIQGGKQDWPGSS